MPLDPLKLVTFNEGEPLDIDKLNSISSNISNTWSATNAVFNTTTSGQEQPWVPVMAFGQEIFPNVLPNTVYTLPLNFDNVFAGLDVPRCVASVRTGLSTGQQVTVSVITLRDNPRIQVVSSLKEANLIVDGIAISKKTVD